MALLAVVVGLAAAPSADALDTSPLTDSFEGGLGPFTVSQDTTLVFTSPDWTHVSTDQYSGVESAFVPDQNNTSDLRLESEPIAIPADAASARLTFAHKFALENTFDGGVLEFAVDGGPFQPDDPVFVGGGYNRTISPSFGSPIAGRHAWSGLSGGFVATDVDLEPFAGHTIRFRFRMASDSSTAGTGWWIDDVQVDIAYPGSAEDFTGATTANDQSSTSRHSLTAHSPSNCASKTPYTYHRPITRSRCRREGTPLSSSGTWAAARAPTTT